MIKDYLIVHRSILPEYYSDVIKARDLVDLEKMSVSDACLKTGISRSTYYKYKDYVFTPSTGSGKKIIIGFKLSDNKGMLSSILNFFANEQLNILTVNAQAPIHNWSYVTMTIDVLEIKTSIEELMDKLKQHAGIKSVNLLAVE
jgi:chorismate mutase